MSHPTDFTTLLPKLQAARIHFDIASADLPCPWCGSHFGCLWTEDALYCLYQGATV